MNYIGFSELLLVLNDVIYDRVTLRFYATKSFCTKTRVQLKISNDMNSFPVASIPIIDVSLQKYF